MSSIQEPKNIRGMAQILADDDDDIDIAEIEKSVLNDNTFTTTVDTPNINLDEEYAEEIETLTKRFSTGANSYEDDKYDKYSTSKTTSGTMSANTGSYSSIVPNKYTIEENDDEDEDEDEDQEESSKLSEWSASNPVDNQLSQMTNEERKQTHINKVLKSMNAYDDDAKFIQQEEDEDEMARIHEQIDLLRTQLSSSGVNIDSVPEVNAHTDPKEARRILRILRIKNDRLRYCDMFEEIILAGAYGLESMFDGQKEWFGTKIDLTGWPDSVKVKLRRMRFDTSSFVSDTMRGYNIGHGWRIIMELIPSLFLYSRDRRLRSTDNLMSDASYRNAIHQLHS